jgi:hypothetical protein
LIQLKTANTYGTSAAMPKTGIFFFFVKPVKEELAALLSSAVPKLSLFYEKGWKSDERQ